MPNKVVRWIRSGVQACMSCILPPKSSVQPPEKKKRKKRRFWMIRRTNKIGVVVPTVPNTKKKASKSKSDAKKGGTKETTNSNANSSTKTGRSLPPAPKRKARINPNCKDCINKVHSPRKMKARLSAMIQARRDQDSLDTPNTADEVETCKKESGKLHIIDLDADNVGGTSYNPKRDTDVCDQTQDGGDDVVCGITDKGHDDDDDIVCGRANTSVEKKHVVESRKDEVAKPMEHGDDVDDDDINCSTKDIDHDDDDDIVCGRADTRVEKKQLVEYKPRKGDGEKPIEHDDDDDIVCGGANNSVENTELRIVKYDTRKAEVEKQMVHDKEYDHGDDGNESDDDHDDDAVVEIGTICLPKTEAVSQKQVNIVGIPTLSEIYDADSSDSDLDLDSPSTSTSESDNEDSNSDTIPEHSGVEMSKSYEQDGSPEDDPASDVHDDDDDDVVCSGRSAYSNVQTMVDKEEHDGRPEAEGDSECHEDAKDTLLGGHSEDSDRVGLLGVQDPKESTLKEKDVPSQGSMSLDKFPTPTRTYSPEKGSYADLILNLASVIGDMKSSSSSSYKSRAKHFGELLGGMKHVNKFETKNTDQLPAKEEDDSHKMAGDMKVESSDDRTKSPEIPQTPLIGEEQAPCPKKSSASATKETSKDPFQTNPDQKFRNVPVDPLDDIDQLLDEASKLF